MSKPYEEEVSKEELNEMMRNHPFNNQKQADEMASNFGMTAEEMYAAGMYPDGTPFDSGPAATDPRDNEEEDAEDFMRAVDELAGDGMWQGK